MNNGELRWAKVPLIYTLLVFLVSILSLPVRGQKLPFNMDMPVTGVSSYDSSIPKPEDIIGHTIGSRHTVPYQVEAYFRAVAAVSDRVTVDTHAQSYEGRNLIHAIVTSPENHGRLDTIRRDNLRLSEAPSSVTDKEIASMPAIVYQGYSVHGNEPSGTEAAILYLYHLAAGRGPAVEEALDNVVVLLDPMLNPDGRDRFTDWANRNRGRVPVSDTQDREHREEWPGGRSNHYWFDLNRDWIATQHPESQGRTAFYHSWRPQVLTDHHEMGSGSTFFFQPGIPSSNNPNTPASTFELTAAIAEYHAAELDRIGSQYYSRESYDDFFYGKGSAYPDINGGVGILFEQAGSGSLVRDVTDGVLHYGFTVRNQFAASLSTLAAGVALRERLLKHQRDFYLESTELANAYRIKSYVVSLDRGRTRAQTLAQLLQRHRVQLYELARDVTVDGKSFREGEAYVIPMDQPQFRFIKAVMESTFEYADSLFYDVSTWTLPLAHDVDYAPYLRNTNDIQGAPIEAMRQDGGMIVGGKATYAYLMPWNRFYSARSLYRFLEAGIPVRVMERPFTALVDGTARNFDRGTMVIPLKGRDTPDSGLDPDLVHNLVLTAADNDHTEFYAVSTGLTPEGPDLGGSSTSVVVLPRLAILAGDGASSSVAGEMWHLLSERFQMPVSLIAPDALDRFDLSRYNVIVHPGGSLDDASSEALKSWTRNGGRLILFSSAVNWARNEEMIDLESDTIDMDSLLMDLDYDQLRAARGAQSIGGSIFSLQLDVTHPLSYGLGEKLPVFHQGSQFYRTPDSDGSDFGVYADNPLLSGYISPQNLKRLPGTVGAVAARSGGGRVIAFMDRLSFRAYWYGSQRLILNAIFLSGAF